MLEFVGTTTKLVNDDGLVQVILIFLEIWIWYPFPSYVEI
jgi:hypothetical protein